MIAFVGSVFSPYYAWRGYRDPEDHCAVNVALYGPGGRWAMTERGSAAVTRSAQSLRIGPSALAWRDGVLTIEVDEIGAPIPRRVRGTIRVAPEMQPGLVFDLDGANRHRWHPIAPRARVEVIFEKPQLSWSGSGYLDSNQGDEPLQAGFQNWTWSRAHTKDGCKVLYDAVTRAGAERSMALDCTCDGMETIAQPPVCRLPPSAIWRIGRETRCDDEEMPRVEKTLEDTPFYARSLVRTRLGGEDVEAFHESLSLDRFANPAVRAMLPFRMPRRGR